jgi:small subunit ribosomal protein S16
MATRIRLTRRGSKKRPYYWIVVADSRSPRDGAYIEKIGTYDPRSTDGEKARVDRERVERWLSTGAQPSERVARLLDQLALRKKAQRYNPKKGTPKAKARERLGDKPTGTKSSVFISSLEGDEVDLAEKMISSLCSRD